MRTSKFYLVNSKDFNACSSGYVVSTLKYSDSSSDWLILSIRPVNKFQPGNNPEQVKNDSIKIKRICKNCLVYSKLTGDFISGKILV